MLYCFILFYLLFYLVLFDLILSYLIYLVYLTQMTLNKPSTNPKLLGLAALLRQHRLQCFKSALMGLSVLGVCVCVCVYLCVSVSLCPLLPSFLFAYFSPLLLFCRFLSSASSLCCSLLSSASLCSLRSSFAPPRLSTSLCSSFLLLFAFRFCVRAFSASLALLSSPLLQIFVLRLPAVSGPLLYFALLFLSFPVFASLFRCSVALL